MVDLRRLPRTKPFAVDHWSPNIQKFEKKAQISFTESKKLKKSKKTNPLQQCVSIKNPQTLYSNYPPTPTLILT
jgi:hypothetical protein